MDKNDELVAVNDIINILKKLGVLNQNQDVKMEEYARDYLVFVFNELNNINEENDDKILD